MMSHWSDLAGRQVLLGVSGGIAAYKSAELCRLLVRAGARVRVMITAAGRRFVGETTFAALSGQPVATELFDPQQEAQIGHIRLADEAEALVFAPATADLIARLAHGLADDLVTTVYLAFRGPVVVAPAMNVQMWGHPATRANAALLAERGHLLVGPAEGEMACGHVGAGRMAEPGEILEAVARCFAPRDLEGRSVLVSAGPTREGIDPVRYLGNRSSGRMGFALAAEACARGARVTLVHGPTALPAVAGVEAVPVGSAAEMAEAIEQRAGAQDAVVMAAAVADYRPADPAATKLKKGPGGETLTLVLERTADILAALGQRAHRPLLVGFAAETGGDLEALAREKLQRKGCDLLVANDVAEEDAGFEVETNRVMIVDRDGTCDRLPLLSKREVAGRVIDRIVAGLQGRR
jgi:phosphopantothenoylcysteine decarboxylase/phosphopantothenate--cysteine ligase